MIDRYSCVCNGQFIYITTLQVDKGYHRELRQCNKCKSIEVFES